MVYSKHMMVVFTKINNMALRKTVTPRYPLPTYIGEMIVLKLWTDLLQQCHQSMAHRY